MTILYESRDGIARITLNRPDRLNSFNDAMHAQLREALDRVKADASVRVLLLTGAGRGFCAGQDLSDRAVAPGGPAVDLGASIERNYKPLILTLRSLPMPVVCAVNGVAAGAGANIALACDLVIATKSASFIQAFCKIGLIPDSGGTYWLPRLVGTARAMGLAMLGDKLSAEQAEAWGLIWKCVDDAQFAATVDALVDAARAGADPRARRNQASALCDGSQYARAATRARAGAAALARLQRRLSRRRRGIHRQATAAVQGALDNASVAYRGHGSDLRRRRDGCRHRAGRSAGGTSRAAFRRTVQRRRGGEAADRRHVRNARGEGQACPKRRRSRRAQGSMPCTRSATSRRQSW